MISEFQLPTTTHIIHSLRALTLRCTQGQDKLRERGNLILCPVEDWRERWDNKPMVGATFPHLLSGQGRVACSHRATDGCYATDRGIEDKGPVWSSTW